jgi:hypothetical protein
MVATSALKYALFILVGMRYNCILELHPNLLTLFSAPSSQPGHHHPLQALHRPLQEILLLRIIPRSFVRVEP